MNTTGKNQPPEFIPTRIKRDEAAFLLNLLADNARPWSRRLRQEVGNFVSPTDALNAKQRLLGRATNPEENQTPEAA